MGNINEKSNNKISDMEFIGGSRPLTKFMDDESKTQLKVIKIKIYKRFNDFFIVHAHLHKFCQRSGFASKIAEIFMPAGVLVMIKIEKTISICHIFFLDLIHCYIKGQGSQGNTNYRNLKLKVKY